MHSIFRFFLSFIFSSFDNTTDWKSRPRVAKQFSVWYLDSVIVKNDTHILFHLIKQHKICIYKINISIHVLLSCSVCIKFQDTSKKQRFCLVTLLEFSDLCTLQVYLLLILRTDSNWSELFPFWCWLQFSCILLPYQLDNQKLSVNEIELPVTINYFIKTYDCVLIYLAFISSCQ